MIPRIKQAFCYPCLYIPLPLLGIGVSSGKSNQKSKEYRIRNFLEVLQRPFVTLHKAEFYEQTQNKMRGKSDGKANFVEPYRGIFLL